MDWIGRIGRIGKDGWTKGWKRLESFVSAQVRWVITDRCGRQHRVGLDWIGAGERENEDVLV